MPTRTPSGISNEHLFHGIRMTVYVEGGDGSEGTPSVDLVYWRSLFDLLMPGDSFYLKPRGGKGSLRKIASDICDGRVTNVLVCWDRDFDHLRPAYLSSSIITTYGYSWENDVWSPRMVEDVFYQLCGVDRHSVPVWGEIDRTFSQFERQLRWIVRADMICMANCNKGVIPRAGFRCVLPPGHGWPVLDCDFLRGCVARARGDRGGRRFSMAVFTKIEVFRDLYGHLLAFLCYRVLASLLPRHSGASSGRETANSLAIANGTRNLAPAVLAHYRKAFASIPGAVYP